MLDKEFENNMKENKDLSKSFAIIFGIKPEEVPSKSSGKNDPLSNSIRTKKDADRFMKDLENITLKDKFYTDLEKQVKETSNKANCTTKEGISHNRDIKNTISKEEELKQASVLENMKEFNKETTSQKKTETAEREYTYKVLFKDNREAVKITTNIMESLSKYFDRRNLNSNGGFFLESNLMWGFDEDTGEMLCLDSNSISSIVRI